MLPDFEEEFAGIYEYARMYRQLGFQAVPSYYPRRNIPNWKRPALKEWRDHQNELVDEETFQRWFSHADENQNNIGIITGNCSGRLFVVDLDTHSKPDAALWWSCCLDLQERAGDLDSPTQRTGGGGLQILFKAPDGWNPPTIKTSIGVDIRGLGGFIVAAPSMHESGKRYEWIEDKEPWNLEVAVAPKFLCDQIDDLAARYGGHTPSDPTVKTETPDHSEDVWGHLVDGREDYMFRMIWARLVDIARDCPIKPSNEELIKERDDLFDLYLSKVQSRLPGPAENKADLLEKEGRGRTEFNAKWRSSLRDWDKVIEHSKQPKKEKKDIPFADRIAQGIADNQNNKPQPDPVEETSEWDEPVKPVFTVVDPAIDKSNFFELLSVDDIYNLPDPVFLVDRMLIEGAMSFIYGVPGCGKTFVALDLALSLANDEVDHWWGRKINKHGPVLYISSEGTADMKFRMQSWEKEKKIHINRKRFHLLRQQINFLDPNHVVKLIQTIKSEIERQFDEPPVAIVIDTVSRVLPGADENLQKDMTLYVQACDALRLAFGCAIIGVHHMSRGGGTHMRGSTVFDGSSDCSLHIEREKPAMIGTMTARKIKASIDGWSEDFILKEVDLGFARSSLVALKLDPATTPPQGAQNAPAANFGGRQETGAEPDPETCRKMVQAIQEAWVGGYPWSRDKKGRESNRYAPDKLADMFGLSIEVCEKYVNMWHKNDTIVTDIWGDKADKRGLRIGKGL